MSPGTPVTAVERGAASTASTTNNLGPLTTIFTPPSTCSTLFAVTFATGFPNDFDMIQGGQCDGNSAVPDLTNCWPPAAASNTPTSTGSFLGMVNRGYYSPGIYCPAGYTSACSAMSTDGAIFQYPPKASETAIGCCPSGYYCAYADYALPNTPDFNLQHCVSPVGSVPVVVATCSSGTPGILGTFTPSAAPATGSGTATTLLAYAPVIQLLRQDTDLSVLFNGPTTPATQSTSQPTSGQTSQQSSQTTDPLAQPTSSSSKHISGGAIAGIVIGALLGLLAVLGAIFYLCRARRRSAVTNAAPTAELGGHEIVVPAAAAAPKDAKVDYPEKAQELEGETVQMGTPDIGSYEIPIQPAHTVHELPE